MPIDLSSLSYRSEFWTLLLPVLLMGIDFLTGFIHAWVKREIKSSIMRTGMGKKAGECFVLLLGLIFVKGVNAPKYILGFFSFYIVVMELVSICENLDKLGVPIPKWIKKGLGVLNEKFQNGSIEHKDSPHEGDETNNVEHDDK